jgi:transcriptional regulator with XRE-family HTH domain
MISLNWSSLVEEAVRRRKEEGITQIELAALANVSAPTVIAFEKGDKRLSLSKALNILSALGLVEKEVNLSAHDEFVLRAFERWSDLIKKLPEGHGARLPNGYVAYDYQIDSKIPRIGLPEFRNEILEKAVARFSGWPPFWLPDRDGLRPYVIDDNVECWLGDPAVNRIFSDPAHSDFWRISPKGHAYLQRGFQEDGEELPKPGTIFDLTLPIWRAAEVLLHADRLTSVLNIRSGILNLGVRYTGLASRQLTSWAKPQRTIFDTYRSKTDEVKLSVHVPIGKIRPNIESTVVELLGPLYEKFDFFRLSEALVHEELSELLSNENKFRR